MTQGFCKAERLHRNLIIDKIFAGGHSRPFSLYHLLIVYMYVD